MKSQDLIENSSKIPKGRKINRDFHFIPLFSSKKAKRLPVAVIFVLSSFEVAQSTKGSPTLILVFYRLFLSFGQKLG